MMYSLARVKYQKGEDLTEFVDGFVKSTFAKFDSNNDGKLSFEEFEKAALENEEVKNFFTLTVADLS
jgi:hypothetical protein